MSFVAAVAAAWATDVLLVYLVTHHGEFWGLAGGFDFIGKIAAIVAVMSAALLAVALRLVATLDTPRLAHCLAAGVGSGIFSIICSMGILGLPKPDTLFLGIAAAGGSASGVAWWAASRTPVALARPERA